MTTGKGCEYVADEIELTQPTYDIIDVDEAKSLVLSYLERRLVASTGNYEGRPVMMLSGGIDSILVAAVLSRVRPDVLAVTFAQPGGEAEAELTRARMVAEHFGFDHKTVEPDAHEFRTLLKTVICALESSEPWEVLAGAVLGAVNDCALSVNADGALVTGGGADALFLGVVGDVDIAHWPERVHKLVRDNFTRHRFIPDFYERLICDEDRHILAWQTKEAFELSQRLHPSVIRGPELNIDKKLFRDLGVPAELAHATKSPMQVSSGGVAAIVNLAREELSDSFGDMTYSDPLTEGLEFTVSRLMLQRLHDEWR